MVHMCTIPSVVMGYHEYKDVWSDPLDGTELSCESKPGIPKDTLAVVVVEQSVIGELAVVGHYPQLFSAIF